MVLGAVIGAAVGIGSSLFGASSANKQASRDRKAQQQSIENQYKGALADWQFGKAQNELNYNFMQASSIMQRDMERAVAIERWQTDKAVDMAQWIVQSTNLRINTAFTNAQNARDVDFQRTLQAADFRTEMRMYEASERTFSVNSQLIAQAALQGYEYQKATLAFQREGFANQRQVVHTQFGGQKREAINAAKAAESKYRSELKQSGLTGEQLQLSVNQKMAEFTQKQEATIRAGSAEAGKAAATGRQGASVNRVMQNPLNQASMAIGALAVELSFFGQERQYEMLKLAEATNLAGVLVDNEREQINIRMQTAEAIANLELQNNNIAERSAISQTNFALADINLQAKSQMNQAESNRMLSPMTPIGIPDAMKVPEPFLPQPFAPPMPLAAQAGLYPMIQKPLNAPKPIKGAMPASTNPGASILVGGIANSLSPLLASKAQGGLF